MKMGSDASGTMRSSGMQVSMGPGGLGPNIGSPDWKDKI